jgi:hypothetical protein
LAEIKSAIEQLSFEERAQLAAWLRSRKDDEWDEQMKRDIAAGKFDAILREVRRGHPCGTAPRRAVNSRTAALGKSFPRAPVLLCASSLIE